MHPIYNQLQPTDYQNYNRYASRGQRVNDGFGVINDNSWSNDQYDASIKKKFKYTDQNYGQALNAAAREGKPVVLIFGSKKTNDTQRLIDGKLPYTQGNRDNAIFCYVDMDRVQQNPNSEMARYVNKHVRPGNNVYTMVFSVSPGRNGEPIPDSPHLAWFGAGDYTAFSINRNIGIGEKTMRGRKGSFRVPDESAEPKDKSEPVTDRSKLPMAERVKRNEALYSEMWNKSLEGGKQTDWRQGQKLFKEATKAADGIDQEAVRFEQKRVSDELATAMKAKDQTKIKELQQKQLELARMADGRSGVRAARGFACMRWGFNDVGQQWLHSSLDINPDLSNTPRFHKMMEQHLKPEEITAFAQQRADRAFAALAAGKKQAGINGLLTAIDLNPDLPKNEKFQASLSQHLSEQEIQSLSEEVKRRFLDSIDPRGPQRRRRPVDAPAETPTPVEKTEPVKSHFSSDEWDAAVAESKRTGKPILLHFTGREWCHWCIALDKQLGDKLDKQLAERAIVVTIDPRNLKDAQNPDGSDSASGNRLAQKFNVGQEGSEYGYPTYMFATLKDTGRGVDVEPLSAWTMKTNANNAQRLLDYAASELPKMERTMEQRGFRKPKPKRAA